MLLRILIRLLYPREFAERFGDELAWVSRCWSRGNRRNALFAIADIVCAAAAIRFDELRQERDLLPIALLAGAAAAFVDLEETRFLPPAAFVFCAALLVGFGRPRAAIAYAVIAALLVPAAHAAAPLFGYDRSPEWPETVAALAPAIVGAIAGGRLREMVRRAVTTC